MESRCLGAGARSTHPPTLSWSVPAVGAGLQRVLGGFPAHLVADEEIDLAHVLEGEARPLCPPGAAELVLLLRGRGGKIWGIRGGFGFRIRILGLGAAGA